MTLPKNKTFSGIVSGSADYIAIISFDSSTSVNYIRFILSKHLRKCPYTEWGFRVCDKISSNSSLDKK